VIASVLLKAGDPVGIGLFLDPSSGQVMVSEGLGVALGAAVWVAAVVAGLITAWLVLP